MEAAVEEVTMVEALRSLDSQWVPMEVRFMELFLVKGEDRVMFGMVLGDTLGRVMAMASSRRLDSNGILLSSTTAISAMEMATGQFMAGVMGVLCSTMVLPAINSFRCRNLFNLMAPWFLVSQWLRFMVMVMLVRDKCGSHNVVEVVDTEVGDIRVLVEAVGLMIEEVEVVNNLLLLCSQAMI